LKPTGRDFAFLVAMVWFGVGFYLERAVWDPHRWSRNSLDLLLAAPIAVAYFGWQAWRWWKRRRLGN